MRMEMGLRTSLQLHQKLVLAPQIIQSIEILQLPAMNLLEFVEQQIIENEAIEIETIEAAPPAPAEEGPSADASESRDADLVQEFMPEDWDTFKPPRRGAEERDRKFEALQNTAGRPASLQDQLADQLGLTEAPARVIELARLLVYSLDDNGLLPPHRQVAALLEATDEHGYLQKPLADVVASVDGVSAVKVPELRGGVTPEQVSDARRNRDRHLQEASGVLAVIQRIRAAEGGAELDHESVRLRYPLVEVLEQHAGDWTYEEVEEALAVVQSLEPRGIGGRTLVESLLLQLDPDDLLYAEKRSLLEDHLEDVKKNRLQRVAREMGLDLEELSLVIEELKGLKLHPGADLAPDSAMAVHPDVVVEEVDGEYLVDLVNSRLPALKVSESYEAILADRRVETEVRKAAKAKIDSARFLIEAIAQRQATLRKVASRIFHHQQDFLLHGDDALRPLKMQTVADEVGVHVSTVSRAIADKWVQTPRGIKPLKFFFTGGTETTGGGMESRNTVKNKVKAIIEAEDGSSPLSDDDIAARMKEMGVPIARRTVTKYRKQLGIPSSRQRRQWV
jgi:RNA polymerase sigma-54 factor